MNAGEQLVELLRSARYAAGVTQRELSARLGVGSSAVSTWEIHRFYPRVDVVLRWCAEVGVVPPEDVAEWFRPPAVRCGTRHGYEVHRSRGENCVECCTANSEYMAAWRANRRRLAKVPLPPPEPASTLDRPRARRAFVAKLRDRRVAAGMKQSAVAKLLGVHHTAVGKWERAEMWPRAAVAEAWAAALDVHVVGGSLDEIFRAERARCGSPNGYRQHRARGEERCDTCCAAWSIYIGGLEKQRRAEAA